MFTKNYLRAQYILASTTAIPASSRMHRHLFLYFVLDRLLQLVVCEDLSNNFLSDSPNPDLYGLDMISVDLQR